jgi:hypothetical protein
MRSIVLLMAASIVILTAVRVWVGSDTGTSLAAFDPKPYCTDEAY